MNADSTRRTLWQRIRLEVVLAVAATVVSFCALGATLYQTYIMQQQQYAAVWPRLDLSHGWTLESDNGPFYKLNVRNVGIGPAIIRKVRIQYQNRSFSDFKQIAEYIAKQQHFPDSLGPVYTNYSDLLPDMVIPQQESRELLHLNQKLIMAPLINKQVTIQVVYESLYGQSWLVTYPRTTHRQIE